MKSNKSDADMDLQSINSLNAQMLGASDDQIKDVDSPSVNPSSPEQTKPEKRKETLKVKRQIIFGAILIGVAGVAAWNFYKVERSASASFNPAVDAAFMKKDIKPISLNDTAIAVDAASSVLSAAALSPVAISGDSPVAISGDSPVAPMVLAASSVVAVASAVASSAVSTAPVASPIAQVATSPASSLSHKMGVDEMLDIKKDLASARAEIEALVRENERLKQGSMKEKAQVKKKVIEIKKKVENGNISDKKDKRTVAASNNGVKIANVISSSNSDIKVLMNNGLIYSANGHFVEAAIGSNIPKYGVLLKVNRVEKTFETNSGTYQLKN